MLWTTSNLLLFTTEKTKDFAEKGHIWAVDALSHGNTKMFSTVDEIGITYHLLDFSEESNETLVAIFENIISLPELMIWPSVMHYYLQLTR